MESSSEKATDFNSLVAFLNILRTPDTSSKISTFQKCWESLSCQVAMRTERLITVSSRELTPLS